MGKIFEALQKVEWEKNHELEGESPSIVSEDHVLDSRLVSFFAPSSMAAEQFRRLRGYIIRPGMETPPKTILVTSAMAGEGKSLIAINLAVTIATEMHSHALIVDCDLRNPTVSRWFGFHEANGLADYLTGEVSLSDILMKSSVNKLSILSGGALQDNPAELIGSNKMKSFLSDLKTRYADRYIILDSSPMLATTEPSVLTEIVDGIIFVIKSGDTPRESIQQAFKLIDKKKIIGIVLNNVEFQTPAMIRRYFGTNRHYYNYNSFQSAPKLGSWEKIRYATRKLKMLWGKLLPRKGGQL